MIIRPAALEDVDDITRLGAEYTEESGWPLTYCWGQAMNYLLYHINAPDSTALVVEEDGIAVGFALLTWDQRFHFERAGYLHKFFVSEEYRKGVGMRFMRACVEWFDSQECCLVFCAPASGISHRASRAFQLLCERYGFRQVGYLYCRGKVNGISDQSAADGKRHDLRKEQGQHSITAPGNASSSGSKKRRRSPGKNNRRKG